MRVEAHLPAGTVVYTKPCPGGGEFDQSILCDDTGAQVIVVVSYDNAGIPTSAFYNLDSSPYTGDTSKLRQCSTSLESDGVEWCFNGVNLTQWVVKDNGEPTGVVYWADAVTGAVIAAPSGPTLVRGVCPLPNVEIPHLIYMGRNTGIITMADIVGISGARHILSVTVKQMAGQGEIKADAGDAVPFDAGETWSWSASANNPLEFITTSLLSMDAGSGEQRITATYIL
jgi:hypothetical protein